MVRRTRAALLSRSCRVFCVSQRVKEGADYTCRNTVGSKAGDHDLGILYGRFGSADRCRESLTYMYEQFYNVRTNPFALTPDPEYLFLSDEQREAIASLMYAVLARRGFSVLIGDAGTGKTTLLRALMRSVPESRAVFSVVVNPTLSPAEFLRTCVCGLRNRHRRMRQRCFARQAASFSRRNP